MIRNYRNAEADEQYLSYVKFPETIPFCFTYNDKEYKGFKDLTLIDTNTEKKDKTEQTKFIYSLSGELEVCLILKHYFSHGATEWTLYFQNSSDHNSGLLSDLKSVICFEGENPVLKGIYGDHENLYKPYEFNLEKSAVHFQSDSGRATHINFPYFNLEYGNSGVMLAIGWAGTWTADFEYNNGKVTYVAKSVNHLKTYLKPGEKIRTALFVVAPYVERNEWYATNYWRSWFIEYNLPKADASGKDLKPFSTCCLASDTGLPNSDGSISERYFTWKPSLDKMIAEDVKTDFRWFDAGWYIAPDLGSAEPFVKGHDWWDTVGTWELDPQKWPGNTFRQSTDYARENGMKTLMWFEPERVTFLDDLSKNFCYKREWAIQIEGIPTISNNIGNEECRKWTTERICKTLRENRVEMYREDNNCDPAALWRELDKREGINRDGISECKLIDGHYQLWDDIISCTLSYGGCGFVDSCASGGGRNDLESMRRGVPILRSDNDRTSTALRLSMTSSFNKWIPFCGANTKEKTEQLSFAGVSDPYVWRASYLPSLNIDSQFVQDPKQNFDILRFGLKEWKSVNCYLLKEFYTLTPWHSGTETDGFTSFMYFDPDEEKGILFAFRQEECLHDTLSIELPWKCLLTDCDTDGELGINNKFQLKFEQPRSAKLFKVSLKDENSSYYKV